MGAARDDRAASSNLADLRALPGVAVNFDEIAANQRLDTPYVIG